MEKRFIDFRGYGPEYSRVKAAIDHEAKVVVIGEYEGNPSTAAKNAFYQVIDSVKRQEDLGNYKILYYDDYEDKVFFYERDTGDRIEEDFSPNIEAVDILKSAYLYA